MIIAGSTADTAIHYYRTAERPDVQLWLLDDDGALVDFTGLTLEFKLGIPGQAASFTKTAGITGGAGSGVEPVPGGPIDGTPNVTLTFQSGELDDLPATQYTWQIRGTAAGLDRVYQGYFYLHDVVL